MDARFCQLTSFHVDLLKRKYLPNLEELYFQGNSLNNSDNFPQIFGEASPLRQLDLSYNNLWFLPNESFENLVNLQKLDLSNNLLKSVDLYLTGMNTLGILDLSVNLISDLSEYFQGQLEYTGSQYPDIKLFIHGNPLSCSCDFIGILNWLQTTNVTVQNLSTLSCANSSASIPQIETEKLVKSCNNILSRLRNSLTIATSASLLAIIIIVSLVAYKQRWKIAWHMYTLKRKLFKIKDNALAEIEDERSYDAFVAYHTDHEIGNDISLSCGIDEAN